MNIQNYHARHLKLSDKIYEILSQGIYLKSETLDYIYTTLGVEHEKDNISLDLIFFKSIFI